MYLAIRYLNYTLIAIAVIALSFAMVTTSEANLDEDTIAGMWTFEEGKGKEVKDLSGNGSDGEFVGDLKWVKGKFGGGLEFDGADTWVKIGTKGEDKTLAALDFTESEGFSIHAWVWAAEPPVGKCVIWKGLGCSTWSQYLLGKPEPMKTVTAGSTKPRSTSDPATVLRDLKYLAMNSQIRNGYILLVHGMVQKLASTLTANYRTPKMLPAPHGHLLKRSTSVLTLVVVNAASGTVLLMKSLSSTWHSPMTKFQNSVPGLKVP